VGVWVSVGVAVGKGPQALLIKNTPAASNTNIFLIVFPPENVFPVQK
jgi:hypothetical protein